MDNIIESIYRSCDQTNTNLVAVSSLIDFIKPYMPNNLDELGNLRCKLDPDHKDPCIDYTVFRSIMNEWIANIQADDVNNSFSEFPNLHQTFSPNVSVVSCTSQSNNNNTINDNLLQEQIEKLQLQLNKATNELDLVKQQLAACEDQNELLLIDINSRVAPDCKQRCIDKSNDYLYQNDETCEEIATANKKCEQLEKLLLNSEKQKQKYMTQVNQLENENVCLKEKLEFFEKVKQEDRKSLSEMRDCLDVKETEISTLMEVIDSLNCDVKEKTELLDFYTNELNLLKQKASDLESLLKTSTLQNNENLTKSNFNTPKLLNQIANPISPTLNSPRKPDASTPITNRSFESTNGNSFDFSCRITMLRSPHKTLKDELAEILDSSNETVDENNQLQQLQNIMKHQEEIKNFLWQNMKQLYNDNELLLDYKRENCEKENVKIQNKTESDKVFWNLTKDLNKLEVNLKQQKSMNLHLQKKLNIVSKSVLKNQLEFTQKIMVDQSTETEIYNEPSKRNNYTKQQMKIEKLLEKQERIEKDLNNERKINTKLTLEYQQECTTNTNLCNELMICRDKLIQQQVVLEKLQTENNFIKELESKVIELNLEMKQLQYENQLLEENLRNTLNKLEIESSLNKKLRLDNDILLNKHYEMKCKVKEDYLQQIHLKKQIIDSTTINHFTIKQLQDEISEKNIEIRTLKKQIEILDITDFVAACNNELKNFIHKFCDIFNLQQDLPNRNVSLLENYGKLQLENEMIFLNTNIAVLVLLVKSVQDKFIDNDGSSLVYNEDSFMSCSSDISFSEDIPDVILTECDEIIENFDLENIDFKNLTSQEREQKFASLALLLSVDITAQRIENERDIFRKGIVRFFSYLNTFSNDSNLASMHLKFLQEMCGDLIKSAVKYGVLLDEKKTMNLWKLIINYVAFLNQEKNSLKKNCKKLTVKTIPGCFLKSQTENRVATRCACNIKKQFSRRIEWKFWFYMFFVVVSGIIIALIVYVDYVCPRNGKRLCPLQWLSNLFIEKVYSPNSYL